MHWWWPKLLVLLSFLALAAAYFNVGTGITPLLTCRSKLLSFHLVHVRILVMDFSCKLSSYLKILVLMPNDALIVFGSSKTTERSVERLFNDVFNFIPPKNDKP